MLARLSKGFDIGDTPKECGVIRWVACGFYTHDRAIGKGDEINKHFNLSID
jgi:hypothetical protein